MSPDDLLLVLCVHGAKHQFEMLKWVCDVAECLRAQRDAIDWARLHERSAALHAGRMVGLGLGLAHELLGAPLPADVARRIRADRLLASLVRERRETLFGESAGSSSSLPRLVFYLRAKDGWRDQARFCATYARQFLQRLVTPTVHDTQWVPLPARFASLYYVLRPVRLLTTYARRASGSGRRSARPARAALPSTRGRPVASTRPRPTKEPARDQ